MKSKNSKTIFVIFSFLFVFSLGFFAGNFEKGYSLGIQDKRLVIENKEPSIEETVDFNLFWDTWDKVVSNYFRPEEIDGQKLMYGAIKGMVSSLGDPYTAFFDPEEFEALKQSMASKYEGIGIEMGFDNNQIIVITPFEGSPAKEAGVEAGDYILKIEDEVTTDMSLSEAATKIRGEEGTEVTLTFLHKGEDEPYEVSIVRSLITYDTVKVSYLEGNIAHISLVRFGDDTNSDWDKVISEVLLKKPSGIILDLRNNPGGYVNSAVYVAGDFIKDDVIVKQKFSDGSVKSVKSSGRGRLEGYNTVILMNEGSASASEILAGALSYYNIGSIVGKKSFGKGIVQDQILLSSGTGLHVTTSEWLTPGDENIHKQGIDPDVEVDITIDEIKNGDDPQLDKAASLLSDSN